MVDTVTKEIRKKTMRAIRSSNTKLEEKVSKSLWKKGIRFRRNVSSLVGKPDIAIKKYKIVIFVDSCFWHGCKTHCRMPKSNNSYWKNKIEKNKKRDEEINNYYKNKGWYLIRIWEHELKSDFEETIDKLYQQINGIKKHGTKTTNH